MPQKLALLAGANPRVLVSGAVVRLYAGTWKVSVLGLKDSELILERKTPQEVVAVNLKNDSTINGDCSVQLHMGKRGTEPELNAFAELIIHEHDTSEFQG